MATRVKFPRRVAGAIVAMSIAGVCHGQGIPACDSPPPGAGNCLVATPGVPGCTVPSCCKIVCADDPFCCDSEWDEFCAGAALLDCGLLNDDCAQALPLGLGMTVAFDTTEATTDGAGSTVCLPGGAFQIHKDLWYGFTAPFDGTFTASLCGSNFDTVIAVYEDCDVCPPGFDPLGCVNDTCMSQSEIEFAAVSGQCSLIRIGGQAVSDFGTGSLVVTSSVPPPRNDACLAADALVVPSTTIGATLTATPDGGAPSPCGSGGVGAPGVWYSVPGTGRTITATTCRPATDYDTQLVVYCGGCDDLICVGGNNNQPGDPDPACDVEGNGSNAASTVSWCSESGRQYLILVNGSFGATGTFELRITDDGIPCPPPPPCDADLPPPNDSCSAAFTAALGDTPFSTLNATTDGPPHGACGTSPDQQVSQDVWFTYSADLTGDLTVSTCGLADFDTRIAIYNTGDCAAVGGATLLGCNDNAPGNPCGQPPDLHSRLVVSVASGSTYLIRVGGTGAATGTGTLRLDLAPMHPACPGPGDCLISHGTPGCENALCCNLVCADMPGCCDVAWDQACADAAAACPPPPPCALQEGSLCQDPDQAGHGDQQLVAAISDANPMYSFSIADDFTATTSAQIREVCWWGVYARLGPPAPGDCGPGPGDMFTIRYFSDAAGSVHHPGTALAGPFTVVALRGETGLFIDSEIGPLREYEYTATHPPVAVASGGRYWVEVLNHTSGDCVWLWSTAPGNGFSHQVSPAGSAYSDLTGGDYDLALCVGLPGPPCPWDLDSDDSVGITDLLDLLPAWGPNPGHPADFDGDGIVGITDLLGLLVNWGPCP
jgi:hypothetical protein